jgi:thioredoxin-related protein
MRLISTILLTLSLAFLPQYILNASERYEVEFLTYSPSSKDSIVSDYTVWVAEDYLQVDYLNRDEKLIWVNDTVYSIRASDSTVMRQKYLDKENRGLAFDALLKIYPPSEKKYYQDFLNSELYNKYVNQDTTVLTYNDTIKQESDTTVFVYSGNNFFQKRSLNIKGVARVQEVSWVQSEDEPPLFDISVLKRENLQINEAEIIKLNPEKISELDFVNLYGVKSKISFDEKYTIIHFWFVGCPYCARTHPILNDYNGKEDLRIYSLSISNGKTMEQITEYVDKHDIAGETGRLEADGNKLSELGINSYPTLMLYNSETGDIKHLQGYKPELGSSIDKFLKK